MIIALGIAQPAPGCRHKLLEACGRIAEASRKDEGCVEYGFHIGLEDPEAVTSVEIWESQAALDAHMTHAHTREFLATVTDLTDGDPQMQFHHTVPAP